MMTRGGGEVHPPPVNRVVRACERCRRQKLKCDESRPCMLCARSGMRCAPYVPAARRPRGRTKKDSRRPSELAGAREPGDGVVKEQKDIGTVTAHGPPHRIGASSSAVGFAVNIFGEHAAPHPGDISSIPGHHPSGSIDGSEWSLQTVSMPPVPVMEALLDAYFDRSNWFICVFHEPQFGQSVRPLLSRTAWREADRGRVIAALTIAAIGLQCVIHDPTWDGHRALASSSLQASSLRDSLIAEVRLHLVDLLDECTIETVQICVMLGTYYIYHGSPSLAWNVLGLSVRTAYALSLHCEDNSHQWDAVTDQVRRRVWNHVTIADTFSAMIYGRPSSLDPSFSSLHHLSELDDSHLPLSISTSLNDNRVTGLTFLHLKYRLYEIIRTSLNRFRGLNLANPISVPEFTQLVETITQMRVSLDTLKSELPPLFAHPPSSSQKTDTLLLQTYMLQVTYESAVIFINRPLLEYHVPPTSRPLIGNLLPTVRTAMDLSLDAALRLSNVPVSLFETHFCISFVLMNFFTAGVILCLPPTIWPMSVRANEAKAGTMRIIRASRRLASRSQIGRHTEELLTKLLKLSLEQEVENGLKDGGKEGDLATVRERVERMVAGQKITPAQRVEEERPTGEYRAPTAEVGVEYGDEPFDTEFPINHQMDEVLGHFGEMLFNLVPNDPYSAWNWGSSLR